MSQISIEFDPDDSAIIDKFSHIEYELWHGFSSSMPDVYADQNAQLLYHEAMFNFQDWTDAQREAIQDMMNDYFMDEYGIDFDDYFDWEGYREWYG